MNFFAINRLKRMWRLVI